MWLQGSTVKLKWPIPKHALAPFTTLQRGSSHHDTQSMTSHDLLADWRREVRLLVGNVDLILAHPAHGSALAGMDEDLVVAVLEIEGHEARVCAELGQDAGIVAGRGAERSTLGRSP